MDFIYEEIGFNKAVYACDRNKVAAVREQGLRVPFSQTDETAPCMDGCHFYYKIQQKFFQQRKYLLISLTTE